MEKNIEYELLKIFFKPTNERPFPLTESATLSFKTMLDNLVETIFNRRIFLGNNKKEAVYIDFYDAKYEDEDLNLLQIQTENVPYLIKLKYKIRFVVITDKGEKYIENQKLISNYQSFNITSMRSYQNRNITMTNEPIDEVYYGGSFINGTNNIEKVLTNIFSKNLNIYMIREDNKKKNYYTCSFKICSPDSEKLLNMDIPMKVVFSQTNNYKFETEFNYNGRKITFDLFKNFIEYSGEFITREEIFNYISDKQNEDGILLLKMIEENLINSAIINKEIWDDFINKKFFNISSKKSILYFIMNIFNDTIFCLSTDIKSKVYPDQDDLATRLSLNQGAIFQELIIGEFSKMINDMKQKEIYKEDLETVNIPIRSFESAINKLFNNTSHERANAVKLLDGNPGQEINIQKQIVHHSPLTISKDVGARTVKENSLGFISVAETPEHGAQSGLNRSTTLQTIINLNNMVKEKKLFNELKLEISKEDVYKGGVMISIVNKTEIPITIIREDAALQLIKKIRRKKINNSYSINNFGIEILYKHKKNFIGYYELEKKIFRIRIHISDGRMIIPTLPVIDGKVELFDNLEVFDKNFSLKNLQVMGYLEYCDVSQVACSNVQYIEDFLSMEESSKKKVNNLFFHKELAFGYLLRNISLNESLNLIRSIYGSSQIKSTVTSGRTNSQSVTSNSVQLAYPSSAQVVSTEVASMEPINKESIGQICLVGIMCYSGNQEDNMVVNKNSIDRGLLSIVTINKIVEETTDHNLSSPQPLELKNSYTGIGANGLRKAGSVIKRGDALYKRVNVIDGNNQVIIDSSIRYNFKEGIVETSSKRGNIKVFITMTISRYQLFKAGDKATVQFVQKGTISKTEYKMPYCSNGRELDIIINFPNICGRKTFNGVYYQIVYNYLSLLPINEDGSFKNIILPTFSNPKNPLDFKQNIYNNINKYYKDIIIDKENATLSKYKVYCPFTNKEIGNMNVTYLQFLRLSHVAEEKKRERETGGSYNKKHRPYAGKQKDGGFKVDEMSVDSISGEGGSHILNSYLKDPPNLEYRSLICKNCSEICFRKKILEGYEEIICQICRANKLSYDVEPKDITMPLAQLIEMNKARGINIKLN